MKQAKCKQTSNSKTKPVKCRIIDLWISVRFKRNAAGFEWAFVFLFFCCLSPYKRGGTRSFNPIGYWVAHVVFSMAVKVQEKI